MNTLHLDFETRSEVDLDEAGAAAYAAHPSTDIICMGYAVDDQRVNVLPKRAVLVPAPVVFNAGQIVAHSAHFEYFIYHFILHRRYGWPELLDPKRWGCTMARALMCGLPGSLDGAALSMKVPFKKDMEGRQALLKICKPFKGKFNEDVALYETVYRYNATDVEVERALDRVLPPLPPEERKLWEADLVINRRGMAIDTASCGRAVEIAAGLTDNLNDELRRRTSGACTKASGIPEMKRWVTAQGVTIPIKVAAKPDENGDFAESETLDIEAIKDLVKDPAVPTHVKDVLRIRQQVGKSSVSKFKAMLACACEDGRVRGGFQYYGAHTGRWAGRLHQPTNFPQGFDNERIGEQEEAIALLKEGAGWFRAHYGDRSMQTLSDILRGMIWAPEGKVFVGADLNAIECRVLNWLAGEQWVLDLFAQGGSPYLKMAEGIYEKKGLSKKGTPREYDIGKRSELGCGFGMGWLRFQANVYSETSKKGEGIWLEDDVAQKAVKVYRGLHRKVVEFWYATESAAIKAVQNPGQLFAVSDGKILWGMSADRNFLCCRLPSGRLLRYFRPQVVMEKKFEEMKPSLHYWRRASKGAIRTDCNGLLGEYRTWGGELVENTVQGAARDFMTHGLLQAEEAGFPVVLHNYDELLAEIEQGTDQERDGVAALCGLMTSNLPAWARNCPVTAEGWVGKRYRK